MVFGIKSTSLNRSNSINRKREMNEVIGMVKRVTLAVLPNSRQHDLQTKNSRITTIIDSKIIKESSTNNSNKEIKIKPAVVVVIKVKRIPLPKM